MLVELGDGEIKVDLLMACALLSANHAGCDREGDCLIKHSKLEKCDHDESQAARHLHLGHSAYSRFK